MNRLLVVLSLLLASTCLAAPPAVDRPNIIVILADDMGFSDIGCYGSEIETPNLDALADDGVRFTQFYNMARCCPSRACLLTGLYPHQAGVGHMVHTNSKGLDGYLGTINKHCVTIAQVLRPAGYDAYAVGKWHVSASTKPEGPKDNWPIARGFERYYGIIEGAANYWDPGTLTRDETMISPVVDKEYQPPNGEPYFFTNAIGDTASRYIREHHQKDGDKPFFLYCAFTADHWPMQAMPKDIEHYKGKYDAGYEPIRQARWEKEKRLGLVDPKWELSPQWGDWEKVQNKAWEARCMEVYAAQATTMDRNVGKIVQALKDAGQYDNTLILYMQDNGGNLEDVGRKGHETRADHPTLPVIPPDAVLTKGEPKQTRAGWPVLKGTGVMPGPDDTYIAYGQGWANVSNVPFREYKHFTHEGGISSPLIAHWPKRITRKGELEKQPAHLIDIMATCVDIAGAQYPKEYDHNEITPMQGVSLLPAFEGKALPDRVIYWEHEGNRAVRQGDWKLVATGPSGAWELYNMLTDRSEMHDLASSEPDRARTMAAMWETWAKQAHVLPWPWTPQYGQPPETDDTPGHVALTLKAGEERSKKNAPPIVGRAITIRATIDKPARDGVIVSHGGTATGYSLYLKDGYLHFATRHDSVLTVVSSAERIPDTFKSLGATLAKDGAVTLSVDDKQVASGKVPGPLRTKPKDGLEVGKDTNAAVGDYTAPFPFKGEIGEVTVELTKE